ncbi:Csa1 family protein [Staphylococcus pettenkoferi]|uniref:Csa1 family protein n=1 Tax=Staphylococcus pettenkoferi TaxID=170573 RepID=UPI003B97E436
MDNSSNKKESKGYYYISDYKEKGKDTEKRYPVIFKSNKIHPINNNISKQAKNKIEQFQFLIQYTDINKNIEKKRGKYFYNPNVSNFKGRYNLNEHDKILKAIKKQYNLNYNQADLLIKGYQEPSTKRFSDKSIQISFNNNYYITNDLIYKPNKKDESE